MLHSDVLHRVLNLLLPATCLLCHGESGDGLANSLCPACTLELPKNSHCCAQCALPLYDQSASLCAGCLLHKPSFQKTIAPLIYQWPNDYLINQFKHRRNFVAGNLLAEILLSHIKAQVDVLPDALLPVPIDWRRRLSRTFNQSEFLAKKISQLANMPIIQVQKIRATTAQQRSNRKQRVSNLHGSFTLGADFPSLNHVAIVDDVMTTGATAETISRLLHYHGVSTVDVWCIARTPKNTLHKTPRIVSLS